MQPGTGPWRKPLSVPVLPSARGSLRENSARALIHRAPVISIISETKIIKNIFIRKDPCYSY